jgi:hypothetical protein
MLNTDITQMVKHLLSEKKIPDKDQAMIRYLMMLKMYNFDKKITVTFRRFLCTNTLWR